jgi:uncharacterized protein (TIGR03435 family)
MSDLITIAYGLKNSSYIGSGPSWLEWDRYDIAGKVSPGDTHEMDTLMLQSLLADRFKLVAHPGGVPVPAYLLTVAKDNPNIKPAAATKEGGCKLHTPANPEPGSFPSIVFQCRGVSMDSLAGTLQEQGGPYLDYSRPVVNATGLKGAYDFDLQWTRERAGSAGISPYQALDQQLSLKLEIKTVPLPGLVIDSVNEEPTPNSPDLDKIMPPLPPQQFEVASIRPSRPDEPTRRRVTADELTYQGVSLKSLITFAWSFNPSGDNLVAPKWIEDNHIDIHAKLPAGESINWNDFPFMMRSLLIDRFQIKYHMEDRPVDAYTLVADHPKLTRADPSERTGCKAGPGRDGKDPRLENPALTGLLTCVNMTMGQFAGQLHRIADGYFRFPVEDATGLKGGWDFTIAFSPASFFLSRAAPGTAQTTEPGDTPSASAPNGAISLLEALRKLGIKAVEEKRPEPILVIDQINKEPTED